MPPSDPNFVNVPADVWTPVAVDTVSVTVNILEAFADVVYYQTYRPTGGSAPDNTANPGDVDFEGIVIFNRRDRIAGKDVFVGGVDFQTSAGIDVYIYSLEKAGKVRVDSLAAGGDGGGAVTSVDTRVGDVTLDDLYEPVFSKNSAFNKNFGSGVGQVAEGNALAVKITGPGSSQINQIFVAIDENGNAKIVPVKITGAGDISGLGDINNGGDITSDGDIKTVGWTDYGGISTIVGFSSVTIKAIWYKKVGKLVFVNYKIIGTSNATNFTFTLPFASKNSAQFVARTAAKVTDNGVSLANSGQAKLTQFSNIVTVYPDWTENLLWTATGTKHAEGQFWYETT